ncbi:hypothetical protein AVEN_48394-1 [Araneus ventricosus]|uniref:Uncharacterized protein n=1 Tax=Araneus ventricosus TaxID=182803 RepID=A0A4Y2IF94_ARAVE|nr:hypothetical protein AVEN_48394-1 [Araneus ventricosus]
MDSKWWNSKSKTPSADSNLGPRCDASGKAIVLPRLGPLIEARNETRYPCVGKRRGVAGILRLWTLSQNNLWNIRECFA